MSRPFREYRIPVRLTSSRGARNKGEIYFDYHGPVYGPDGRPRDSFRPDAAQHKVYSVLADTHTEAYRALCLAVRHGDGRPIMGRTLVKWFIVPDAN